MNRKITDMAYIAVAIALLSLCSWIALPSAVPITLQTFAVFTVLSLLGGRRGVVAITLYVIIGAFGLPVFSHFKGGLPILLTTPSGGYIIGFVVMALLYLLAEVTLGKSLAVGVVSMAVGLISCYALGALFYIRLNLGGDVDGAFYRALAVCVTPFIIPDAVKLFLAVFVTQRLKRHLTSLKR